MRERSDPPAPPRRIIATAADLEIISERETFSVQLEKRLLGAGGKRGRIDVWFRITDDEGRQWRCAIELKFFKRKNHREPNNRYEVFKDIARLESCGDVADVGFMIVGTDHLHYVSNEAYSGATSDFDFRNGAIYQAGRTLSYNTGSDFGPPITLARDYQFQWAEGTTSLHYLLVEVSPTP